VTAAAPATAAANMAAAFAQIADLRGAGFDLVVPMEPDELARLVCGSQVVIVVVPPARPRTDSKEA